MHLLFVLFDFTIVFCFAWDDYVASFCNSPFFFFYLFSDMISRFAARRPSASAALSTSATACAISTP